MLKPVATHARRDTDRDRIRRDVLGNNGASPDDGAIPDCDSWHNNSVGTDPYIVADRNALDGVRLAARVRMSAESIEAMRERSDYCACSDGAISPYVGMIDPDIRVTVAVSSKCALAGEVCVSSSEGLFGAKRSPHGWQVVSLEKKANDSAQPRHLASS